MASTDLHNIFSTLPVLSVLLSGIEQRDICCLDQRWLKVSQKLCCYFEILDIILYKSVCAWGGGGGEGSGGTLFFDSFVCFLPMSYIIT